MKIDKTAIIISTILFILVSIILIPVILMLPSEDSIKEVKCYDRHSNEIVGQICEEEIKGVTLPEKILIIGVIEMILLFICFTVYKMFSGIGKL